MLYYVIRIDCGQLGDISLLAGEVRILIEICSYIVATNEKKGREISAKK